MDFDYTQLPSGYTLCPNAECPRADQCLRQALFNDVPASLTSIRILSPAATRQAAGPRCPHFRALEMRRFARGIDALLVQLRTFPYNDSVWLKKKVYNYFGRWAYYEIKHKRRLITPEEQAEIQRIFRSKGISAEPAFDGYVVQNDFN